MTARAALFTDSFLSNHRLPTRILGVEAQRLESISLAEGPRPIEQLKEILGRYSVAMTERYAHLRPDLWGVMAGTHSP